MLEDGAPCPIGFVCQFLDRWHVAMDVLEISDGDDNGCLFERDFFRCHAAVLAAFAGHCNSGCFGVCALFVGLDEDLD